MSDATMKTDRLVTVFGGSGFIGRHVVRALAKRGWRIRVAVRRPDLAYHLQPIGRVGQIHAVQANLRYPVSVAAALRGADAAVNLVGILAESGRQRFETVQTFGARAVAKAVRTEGIKILVHMSAIGADENAESLYARTKARGEAAARELVPEAVITRASVVFGPEDSFFNRFASLARTLPALPLIGGGKTKFEPVFVGDLAEAIGRAVDGQVRADTYEFGGPEVKTFRELMQFVCDVTGRRRLLIPVPFGLARVMAHGTEIANALSFGFFPQNFLTTSDQVTLLRRDNVVSDAAKRADLTLQGLGIAPTTIESIVPSYLVRFRKTGQFDHTRMA